MTTASLLIEDARGCARLFRLGRDIEAALQMVTLIEAAMPLFAPSHERQPEWTRVLTEILNCQELQDWIGLADWLDCEFIAMLESN